MFGCVDHLRDRRLPGGQLPRLSPELRAELRVFRGERARRQHERGYPLHERLGATSAGDVNPRRLHDAGEDPQGERRHRGAERELLAGPRYRQDLRDGRRKRDRRERDRRERGRLHHSRGAHVFRVTTFHVDPRSNNLPPGAMDGPGPGGECASRANRAGSRAMKRDGSRGRGDGRHLSSRERGGPSDTRGGTFCPEEVRFSRVLERASQIWKKNRGRPLTTRGVPRLGDQISTRRRAHTPRANAHAVSSPIARSAPSRNPEVPRARLA